MKSVSLFIGILTLVFLACSGEEEPVEVAGQWKAIFWERVNCLEDSLNFTRDLSDGPCIWDVDSTLIDSMQVIDSILFDITIVDSIVVDTQFIGLDTLLVYENVLDSIYVPDTSIVYEFEVDSMFVCYTWDIEFGSNNAFSYTETADWLGTILFNNTVNGQYEIITNNTMSFCVPDCDTITFVRIPDEIELIFPTDTITGCGTLIRLGL